MQKLIIMLFMVSTYLSIRIKWPDAWRLRFNGPFIDIFGRGDFKCGSGCYLSHFTRIFIDSETKFVMGDNVSIGHNVRVYTSKIDPDFYVSCGKKKIIKGDVIFGSNIILSANVYIGPGVAICSNVIVGVNSVVTKSIVTPGIYAGAPARLISRKLT